MGFNLSHKSDRAIFGAATLFRINFSLHTCKLVVYVYMFVNITGKRTCLQNGLCGARGKVGLLFLSRPARASLLQHGHTQGCSTSALLSVPEDIAAFDMLAVSALISLQILSAVTAMIIYFQRNYLEFFLTHEFFCK